MSAILSLSDKKNLVELGTDLNRLGIQLIASGGTATVLKNAGLKVQDVSDITGAPEMLGGRVKTLHPAVHGGILARSADKDKQELASRGYHMIDFVICNLYPFQETISKENVSISQAIEEIDIGKLNYLNIKEV
jgi:phosphoribosylaminoimidazolecarboxamide formyltransferase/IMP cyclohydrolase